MNAEETTSGPDHKHLYLGAPKDGFLSEDGEGLFHAHDGDDIHAHKRRYLLYPTTGNGPLMWSFGMVQSVPALVETY